MIGIFGEYSKRLCLYRLFYWMNRVSFITLEWLVLWFRPEYCNSYSYGDECYDAHSDCSEQAETYVGGPLRQPEMDEHNTLVISRVIVTCQMFYLCFDRIGFHSKARSIPRVTNWWTGGARGLATSGKGIVFVFHLFPIYKESECNVCSTGSNIGWCRCYSHDRSW